MTTVIIKKYANQKLYVTKGNTEPAGVVNLTKIIDILRKGKSVKVVDNVSGEDITERILKSALDYVPVSVDQLEGLIRG